MTLSTCSFIFCVSLAKIATDNKPCSKPLILFAAQSTVWISCTLWFISPWPPSNTCHLGNQNLLRYLPRIQDVSIQSSCQITVLCICRHLEEATSCIATRPAQHLFFHVSSMQTRWHQPLSNYPGASCLDPWWTVEWSWYSFPGPSLPSLFRLFLLFIEWREMVSETHVQSSTESLLSFQSQWRNVPRQ